MTYDQLWLGRRFRPLEFEVEPQAIQRYRAIFGGEGAGGGAPLGLMAVYARRSYLTEGEMPSGGVMATLRIEVDRPIPIDVPLRMQGVVVGQEERKGRKWVSIESEFGDSAGPVGRTLIVGIWPR